ncbi:MAG TPA: hypothetical protein VFQ25_07720 [Ktedonobacterales bacterium]|nr:hypothetical protein [Ktedonobacterales bacterium]
MVSNRAIGLLVGLALGVIWVALGFGAALLCAVLAFLGWLIAGIVTGEVSLNDIVNELRGRGRSAS